ncbi:hypothetical protein FRB90_007709 [Tulasnella sp. 427]|nr:hypothetical protein FRB90_007709 [Tulasnella sp. 427]
MSDSTENTNEPQARTPDPSRANSTDTSPSAPAAAAPPASQPVVGASSSARDSTQSEVAASSLPTHRPSRVRTQRMGPGEFVWEVSPSAPVVTITATSATPAQESSSGRFRARGAPQPWETRCKCTYRTLNPRRHWTHHCPCNLDIVDLQCEFCGTNVGRPDHLTRHYRQSQACREARDRNDVDDDGPDGDGTDDGVGGAVPY